MHSLDFRWLYNFLPAWDTVVPALRPIATVVLSIVLLQILLGIVSFMLRLLDFDKTTGFVLLTAVHVSVGALTLAASLVLAIEVRRCRPLNIRT